MKIFKLKIRKFPSNITWFSFRQHIYESSNIVLDSIVISNIFYTIETGIVGLITILGLIAIASLIVIVFLCQCLRSICRYVQYSLYLLPDIEEQKLQKYITNTRNSRNE